MTIPLFPSFGPIAERYDFFILDLWGVVHDGHTAYPGAAETLRTLQERGKTSLLLSNAPRRAHALVSGMEAMGIPRSLYFDIFSSGEVVHQELVTRRDPFYAALGRRCLHIGPPRDLNLFEGVEVDLVDTPEMADFVLNTGPVELDETLEDYLDLLAACAKARLPMVCANPDHVVIRDNQRIMCAGALAAHYAGLGLPVSVRGKPDRAVYDLALERLGVRDKSRVLVVGDALETDIKGATGAGLDSLLVTGGIHAEELGAPWGQMADPARVHALAERFGLSPIAAIPSFVW
ncbi:MAG: HAD family hydrolase [Alphaproteobacteria bacterium RIFOXYD12_FULL_60_8]|nr:MAG: HAD family hydrolase [Alphaproteobacteria bacterium RIFOXYD12_FULL_60_8]